MDTHCSATHDELTPPNVGSPLRSTLRAALLAVALFVGFATPGAFIACGGDGPGTTTSGDDGSTSPADDDDDKQCAKEDEDCDGGETCCEGLACSALGTCQLVFTCATNEECRTQFGANFECNALLGQCEQKAADVCAVPCASDAQCACAGYTCDTLLGTCAGNGDTGGETDTGTDTEETTDTGPVCSTTSCGGSETCCTGFTCSFGSCVSTDPCDGKCTTGQVCNETTGNCVADCRTAGCTNSSDTCNQTSGLCESCAPQCTNKACGDNGCGGTCGLCPVGQTCDTSTPNIAVCRAPTTNNCQINTDCTADPAKKVCDSLGTKTCVQCLADADCSGSTPKCNTTTKACEAGQVTTPGCLAGSNCTGFTCTDPSYPICNNGQCCEDTTPTCTPACGAGEICQNGTCVPDGGTCDDTSTACTSDQDCCTGNKCVGATGGFIPGVCRVSCSIFGGSCPANTTCGFYGLPLFGPQVCCLASDGCA